MHGCDHFAPNWFILAPKLDKCGTFTDQISVYFSSGIQNELKSVLKKTRICPICGQSDPLWSQTWFLWCSVEAFILTADSCELLPLSPANNVTLIDSNLSIVTHWNFRLVVIKSSRPLHAMSNPWITRCLKTWNLTKLNKDAVVFSSSVYFFLWIGRFEYLVRLILRLSHSEIISELSI